MRAALMASMAQSSIEGIADLRRQYMLDLLMAGGAAEVVVAAVGKYPTTHSVLAVRPDFWDPYSEQSPASNLFARTEHWGTEDRQAHSEFVASFRAMEAETW